LRISIAGPPQLHWLLGLDDESAGSGGAKCGKLQPTEHFTASAKPMRCRGGGRGHAV
jgi:hypothetical protein